MKKYGNYYPCFYQNIGAISQGSHCHVVLDIAAIIHMSQPTADLQQKHYLIDYVPMHLVPYLESQLTPQLSHQVITDDAR